ncbi:MAG: PilX N-terminal domain-containing pilus assembly protein [Marinobacter sp.]|uniref:pilus assembly PilX family protein n=1 Tax=Marinobacter sp. TaxID=50741 RepID=UPI00299F1FB6|nr:PilX N-terminal domain-containing pilus assembly protein [Marinobacter sp.]MDX1634644.1 PilX N-terminal domain-containing pilus assembly protein [Marinobacter sp.]
MIGPRRQQGAALIVSLILLLVLSLLATSSMERVTLQELMVNAQRDGEVALELTEEVLREAERRIDGGLLTEADFTASGPLYSAGAAPAPEDTASWREDNSFAATETQAAWAQTFGRPVPMPRYYIELVGDLAGMGQVTDVVVSGRHNMTANDVRPSGFRVVAMSQGFTGDARRIVEVYYAGEL